MNKVLAYFCDSCLGSVIPGVLALHPTALLQRKKQEPRSAGEKAKSCSLCGLHASHLTEISEQEAPA